MPQRVLTSLKLTRIRPITLLTRTHQMNQTQNDDIDTTTYTTTTNTSKPKKKTRTGRHGARNQHRHKQVVKWIVQKFPNEIALAKDDHPNTNTSNTTSNTSSTHHTTDGISNVNTAQQKSKPNNMHILDVAGGKGELSARLTICHRLHVKMVDPRPANPLDCFHKLILRSLPNKWQTKISQNPTAIEDAFRRRFEQHVMYFPADAQSQMCIETLEANDVLLQTVMGCSLMIGMHSDGATEAIVDIAMKYRKAFMVVPCCVFPNFFKHRFLPRRGVDTDTEENGKECREDDLIPVRSHEQFCKYLLLKDSHFTEEILPFEGRNVAICWDGQELDGDDV